MRCVVDASVIIKWFVPEPDTPAALALRTRFQLVAPELLVAEFGNILATKIRMGDFDRERADMAAESLRAAGIGLRPMAELLTPALRLASQLQHPAYDCFYLAMAQMEGCPLVTADQRFLRAVEARGDVSQKASCRSLTATTDR